MLLNSYVGYEVTSIYQGENYSFVQFINFLMFICCNCNIFFNKTSFKMLNQYYILTFFACIIHVQEKNSIKDKLDLYQS